jgi:hypothetical protein
MSSVLICLYSKEESDVVYARCEELEAEWERKGYVATSLIATDEELIGCNFNSIDNFDLVYFTKGWENSKYLYEICSMCNDLHHLTAFEEKEYRYAYSLLDGID